MKKKVSLKTMDWLAGILSIIVLTVIILLRSIPPIGLPFDVHVLPPLHAILNSLTAISLISALYFIKQKNISRHKTSIYIAMGLSVAFLLSYVIYHSATEPTRYGGEGIIKYIYFFFLATHVILAAVILPFILFTFARGFTMEVEKHKRLARWTFPIWLYVAITGVICYLMLMPYY